jgi:FMN phosphatase YigB (HAD superfamily)
MRSIELGLLTTPSTVFLDWGGTLAQEVGEFREPWKVWAHVLADQGQSHTEDQIRRAISAVDAEIGHRIYEYLGRTGDFWKLHDDRVMNRLGIRTGRREIEISIQKIFDDPTLVRLYPETQTVLSALRNRGYRTGIISNHTDGLLRVLRYHRLDPLLDTVTYSQEAGAEKPNPAVFRLALRRAGCEAGDAVFVGNDLQADVEGARSVGIRPIWLNRQKLDLTPGCPAIESLEELVPLLDTLGRTDRKGAP